MGLGSVMGSRSEHRKSDDQRSCRDAAGKTLVSAACVGAPLPHSCRWILRMATGRQSQDSGLDSPKEQKAVRVRGGCGIRGKTLRRETSPSSLPGPTRCFVESYNRMPVIYDEPMGRQWLGHSYGDRASVLAAVLRPWPSDLMEAHNVSTVVNSPESDSPVCFNRCRQ